MAANKERTFIMVKPDGVQRGLVGKIIKRFETKGFKLVAMKFMWVSTNRFSSPTGCRKCPNLTFRNLVADEEKHKIKKIGGHSQTTWKPFLFANFSFDCSNQQAEKELLEKHYADLSARPFFPGLVNYMNSGPVVPMVWEGLNVVKTGRQILGATNPADSAPGTIRGDLCIQVGRNIIHGSDAVESANKEIALWFTEKELVAWTPASEGWVYE